MKPSSIAVVSSVLNERLWSVISTPDMKDVTHVITGLQQGGLGLPDRDFYLRTDDTSKHLLAASHAFARAGSNPFDGVPTSRGEADLGALVSRKNAVVDEPDGYVAAEAKESLAWLP